MDRSPAANANPALRWIPMTFWILWTLALLLKLELATLCGTFDIPLYAQHGTSLLRNGFAVAYASNDLFTVPPMAAGYAAVLSELVRPGGTAFGFLIRLPGILAEALFAIALWRRFGREAGLRQWVPAIFVLNPLSLMVTGFHGNLDGLLTVFVGAALLMAIDGRPVASGIWLGLACNMKVSPVLLLPAFFFWWLAHGQGRSFTMAAAGVILAGWSPGLVPVRSSSSSGCLGTGASGGRGGSRGCFT